MENEDNRKIPITLVYKDSHVQVGKVINKFLCKAVIFM